MTSHDHRQANLLLVEDNLIITEVLSCFIQKLKHQLTHVDNAERAVLTAEQHKFDLILMNLGLVNHDGIWATQCIRAFDVNTPIIGYTSDLLTQALEIRCLRAGMQMLCNSWLSCRELEKALAMWL